MRVKRLIAALLAAVLPVSGASAACLGMQVHAHRGAPTLPENSLASISAAYAGGWDGVEIDMQRLQDGRWVLHHDVLTGRTVGGVGRKAVLQLNSADWRGAKLMGQGGGSPPPFLDDALRVAAAQPAKTFNAELKVVYRDCAPVSQLVAGMKQSLPHGNWMITSAFPEALRCVRGMPNPSAPTPWASTCRSAPRRPGSPVRGWPIWRKPWARRSACTWTP
ncbi:hypothetical protein G6F62_013538 [Rhizopus arrhizus]|nr:hypothetical protein G6F62_013538 [Rhizopus arrhizus]